MPPSSKSRFLASRCLSWCRELQVSSRRTPAAAFLYGCAWPKDRRRSLYHQSQEALHGLASWVRWLELEKL